MSGVNTGVWVCVEPCTQEEHQVSCFSCSLLYSLETGLFYSLATESVARLLASEAFGQQGPRILSLQPPPCTYI